VIQRVAGPKDLRMNRTPGDRLESNRPHEFARAASHHDVDLSARLRKQTRQPH